MKTLTRPPDTTGSRARGPTCAWPRETPRPTATSERALQRETDRPTWLPAMLPDPDRGDAGPSEPEGLARSSCAGPQSRLARSAIAAASAGMDRATWEHVLARHAVPARMVADAQRCARSSGIWPWP